MKNKAMICMTYKGRDQSEGQEVEMGFESWLIETQG